MVLHTMSELRPPAPEPLEIEVKLSVAIPGTVRRLLRNPEPARLAGFHAVGVAHDVRVDDHYLDTAMNGAGRLAAAAMRARVRWAGGEGTVTVKRAGVEDRGITTRVELEGPATRSMEPRRWPASDARSAMLEAIGNEKLHEIARLRQRRLTLVVERGDTQVEVSLDALEAMANGRVAARRTELEAELRRGNVGDLEELADAFRAIPGVGPALGSKLRFALDAAAGR